MYTFLSIQTTSEVDFYYAKVDFINGNIEMTYLPMMSGSQVVYWDKLH